MYKVLIVDDEMYAVMGIKSGVDWEALQVSEIYEAYNLRDALKVFERAAIDVMICDIEMPKGTGIELLERVNDISPETETIFLTAHAHFDFMQRAIQLDGFDYLLKPIEYDVLKSSIARALESVRQEREMTELRERYNETWQKRKGLITEKFWNDVLTRRIHCTPDNVLKILQEHELLSLSGTTFMPVLVSVESWMREYSTRDEEMMEYNIRKAAEEILLDPGRGEVIQTKQGVNVVILYGPEDGEIREDTLYDRCMAYLESCRRYFHCTLSCYIGEPSTLFEIGETYQKLLEMEYVNLNKSNEVYRLAGFVPESGQVPASKLRNWIQLLELGKLEDVERDLKTCLAAQRLIPALSEKESHPSVIQRVQGYIAEHLHEPITREQLACCVHLNPAYLSRLFKRETGESITDYILRERMEAAKEMIRESSMPISDVAKSLGYYNFSHFSKMFKKVHHASPQQVRRKSV
ncbi:hypothetical protein BCV73_09365 [Paenibacillus sp. SSG-1]|uniref:helix-turn-helix domain-containing protein n=1 Tax=Paenibacillus sp. SSG-1 TaxID=1443669 RepID=UPI000B7E6971|nr:helix-turn-helix domain-containing protein [Paenibacillus sp. SSG-1]OXL83265.1 hypothetical protein BCV73_09365 [Paenibacillus sp. SSG-1]